VSGEELAEKHYRLVDSRRAREALSYSWGFLVFEGPPESVHLARLLVGDSRPLVVVGDEVSRSFSQYYRWDVAVVDFRSRRVSLEWSPAYPSAVLECENPPSSISSSCVIALKRALAMWEKEGRVMVVVRGEEDLLSLPAILLCPDGGWVVYGNWRGFLSLIPCTPLFRGIARRLLLEFFKEAESPH
jgi:uncharacterized protein (UPF0218 family)